MRTRLLVFLLVALSVTALAACEPPVSPPPAPDPTPTVVNDFLVFEVQANQNEFIPNEFVVPANQAVIFMMTSVDDLHTFTVRRDEDAEEDLFDLQVLAGFTDEVTYTFEEPGDYYLYCRFHEQDGMVGTIQVVEE